MTMYGTDDEGVTVGEGVMAATYTAAVQPTFDHHEEHDEDCEGCPQCRKSSRRRSPRKSK